MNTETPVIERAFQIARGGLCANTNEVRRVLTREGYTRIDQMHISPTIVLQLKKLCVEARAKR